MGKAGDRRNIIDSMHSQWSRQCDSFKKIIFSPLRMVIFTELMLVYFDTTRNLMAKPSIILEKETTG